MKTATCPVCEGTTRVPANGSRTYGFDEATGTIPCCNCGGQTMSLQATGKVTTRPDGTPCTHEWKGREAGRCYTVYTCQHCADSYAIDSSD